MMKRLFRLALFQSEKMVVRMYNSVLRCLMLRLSGLSVLAEQILFELDISQTCPRLIPYPAEHIANFFFQKSFNF